MESQQSRPVSEENSLFEFKFATLYAIMPNGVCRVLLCAVVIPDDS